MLSEATGRRSEDKRIRNAKVTHPHNKRVTSLVNRKVGIVNDLSRQLGIQQMRRVIAYFKLVLRLHEFNSGMFLNHLRSITACWTLWQDTLQLFRKLVSISDNGGAIRRVPLRFQPRDIA